MSVTVIPTNELEYMMEEHKDAVLDLDARSCAYFDPDIDLIVVHPHAWTNNEFLRFMKQRIPPTHGYVMKLPESAEPAKVVAYMAYELMPEEIHLLSLVVDPELRKQGLGLSMLLKLHKAILRSQTRKTISIHVREHDDASIGFFKAMRFKSRLCRAWFEDGEDAIRFHFTERKTLDMDGEEY